MMKIPNWFRRILGYLFDFTYCKKCGHDVIDEAKVIELVKKNYTPNTEVQKEREEAYKKGYIDGVLSYKDNNLSQTKGGKE